MENHSDVLLATLQNGRISIAIVAHPSASMSQKQEFQHLSLIERIQRTLVLLAHFIQLDADVHIAVCEQFEKELEALKQRESTKFRARHLLMAYGELAAFQIGVDQVSAQLGTDAVRHGSLALSGGRLADAVIK